MSDPQNLPRPGDTEYGLLWKIVSVLSGGAAPPVSPYDSDALEWATVKVPANGGSVSQPTLQAVSDFCTSLKANNLWTLVQRINLYAGDQLAACLTPLKDEIGFPSIDTNSGTIGFVAGDYSQSTGLKGTFATPPEKYLNTGVSVSLECRVNNYHLALLVRTNEVPGGASYECGAWETGPDLSTYILPNWFSTGESYFAAWDDNNPVDAPDATAIGFYQGTRNGTDVTLFKNGVSAGTGLHAGSLPNATSFYIHAVSVDDGTPQFGSGRTLAGYSLGLYMTPAQAAQYFTAWQTFQLAIGRM